MIARFLFVSVLLPWLDLYVKLFVAGEKLYRQATGRDKPGVPEHLRNYEPERQASSDD